MRQISIFTLILAALASTCLLAQPLVISPFPVFAPEEGNGVSIGYQNLDVTGSKAKFGQYYLPSEGSSLETMSYSGMLGGSPIRLQSWLVGDTSRNGYIRYYPSLGGPGSLLRISSNYNEFSDRRELFPVLSLFDDASRRNGEGSLWISHPGTVYGVELGFNSGSRNSGDQSLLLPDYGYTDVFTRLIGTSGLWGTEGMLGYRSFRDSTNAVFDTKMVQMRLGMDRPVGEKGSFAWDLRRVAGQKNQNGLDYKSALRHTEASADYVVRPSSDLSVRAGLKLWNRTQPQTRTSYARRLTRASVDARWNAMRSLDISGGYQTNAVRYLQVDTGDSISDYNVLWGRARFNATDRLSIWANYRRRALTDQPDDRLQPERLITLEGRAAYSLTDRIFLEGSRTRNRIYNPARGVDYWQDATTLALSSPINSKLSVSADFSSYEWTSGSDVLDLYLTDTRLVNLGLSYIIAPGFTARVGLGRGNNSGVIDEDRSYWYAATERMISRDRSLGLRVGKSAYNDDTFNFNDYRAGGVLLTLTNKY